jgi:hypothetical protein
MTHQPWSNNMGLYINPTSQTKEEFLLDHAKRITPEEFEAEPADGQVHLAWVNNGAFTALAIGFSQKERLAFLNPSDPRRRLYYTCPISSIGTDQGPAC